MNGIFVGSSQEFLHTLPAHATHYLLMVNKTTQSTLPTHDWSVVFVPASIRAELVLPTSSQNVLIVVQEGAVCKLQGLSDHGELFSRHIVCVLEEKSTLNLYMVHYSGVNHDMTLDLVLMGAYAQAQVRGLCVAKDRSAFSLTTRQHHVAQSTMSDVLVKAILADQAEIFFKGTIVIDEQAPKSSATLYNKNILLSEQARAISMPQLEVATNDVQCKHGTATSTYDAAQLNYLQARGLDIHTARTLLLASFVADCVEQTQIDAVETMLSMVTKKYDI